MGHVIFLRSRRMYGFTNVVYLIPATMELNSAELLVFET